MNIFLQPFICFIKEGNMLYFEFEFKFRLSSHYILSSGFRNMNLDLNGFCSLFMISPHLLHSHFFILLLYLKQKLLEKHKDIDNKLMKELRMHPLDKISFCFPLCFSPF